ncbi:MAG: threonylcarbamoyl-AMP synthase [Chloroflexota bacterium]
MLHLSVDPEAPDPAAIRQAAEAIRRGELVAFPTETVYGLGADALDPAAVARIFEAKGRPADNPLIVHVARAEDLDALVRRVPPEAHLLAAYFWPGPLTLVLPRRPHVPDITTGGLNTVAVRVPAHPVALALIEACGRPLAAPSANRSGRPSPTRAEDVIADLGDRVAVVLDAGPCSVGLESTVLDLSSNTPVLLRPGGVSREAIEAVVGPVRLGAGEAEGARSPGTRYRHYAPRARLLLAPPGEAEREARRVAASSPPGVRVGVIARAALTGPAGDLEARVFPGSVEAYARGLFAALRDLDAAGCTVVVAESVPDEGIGLAVMDRLRRAASGSGGAGDARA